MFEITHHLKKIQIKKKEQMEEERSFMDKDAVTTDRGVHEFMKSECCRNGNSWPQEIEKKTDREVSIGSGN